MRKRLTSITAVLFAVMLGLIFVLPVGAQGDPGDESGDGVVPTFEPGNPDCTDLGYTYGFKIDQAPNGVFTFTSADGELIGGAPEDPSNSVTILNSDGIYFDWSSTLGIDAVLVKGGPNADAFAYDPPEEDFEDTELHAPINPNTGEPYAISHIEFCYDLEAPEPGTIIIEKQTEPDGATESFTFSGDVAGVIPDGGQLIVSDLPPGTYTSQETVPAGWDLTSIVCDDANSSGDVNTATATFQLEAGETVKCTFTNTQRSTIIIAKNADPADGTDFPFTSDLGDFTLDDADPDDGDAVADSITFADLAAGTYAFEELAPAGWDLHSIVCTYSGDTVVVAIRDNGSLLGVSIEPAPGDEITCTFNNEEQPPELGSLEVTKVVNWSGFEPDISQTFEICISGPSYPTGTEPGACQIADYDGAVLSWPDIEVGEYTVTETDPGSEWMVEIDDSPVTVEAGSTASVTVTNTHVEKPTAITLASFSFEAVADGVALVWETMAEIDNAGFNVYRATSPDGPFTRVNADMIAAQGSPVAGARYSFTDAPGAGTFYYRLEDVDFNGTSTFHGPIQVTLGSVFARPLYRPMAPGQ